MNQFNSKTKKALNSDVDAGKLRDTYAGIVLTQMINGEILDKESIEDTCSFCYEMADAMMNARG
jgi:hypothetical protein